MTNNLPSQNPTFGAFSQKQKDYFTLRLRFVAGDADVEALERIAQISREFGQGKLHLTTRQGIEIPWIPVGRIEAAQKACEEAGLQFAAHGAQVRSIVGCPGSSLCKRGTIDTKTIAQKLDATYFGTTLPHKFKIAVTGCSNNCAKSTENDLGIMGIARPRWIASQCSGCDHCLSVCPNSCLSQNHSGDYCVDLSQCQFCSACVTQCPSGAWTAQERGYTIWMGGTMGKQPRLATVLARFVPDEDSLFSIVKRAVDFYSQHGRPKERFARTLERYGIEKAKQEILSI